MLTDDHYWNVGSNQPELKWWEALSWDQKARMQEGNPGGDGTAYSSLSSIEIVALYDKYGPK